MSAAEPARPAPSVVNTIPGADVIDISTRTPSGGRWKPVGTPRPDSNSAGAGAGAPRELAEHYELVFNREGFTLTDDETAAVYRLTLKLTRSILQGARVKGIIGEEERAQLDALVAGMAEVPDHL